MNEIQRQMNKLNLEISIIENKAVISKTRLHTTKEIEHKNNRKGYYATEKRIVNQKWMKSKKGPVMLISINNPN